MKPLAALFILLLSALAPSLVRAGQPERHESLPPQIVIDDLRDAYSHRIAEEVEVRYRAPQAPVRTESFTVRVDPGPRPGDGPARLRLDLGQLRIHFADGLLTATSQAAPEVYFQKRYDGPIAPELLARHLPPLPLPQLALAGPAGDGFASPTAYTPEINWVSATLKPDLRPAVATMIGTGPGGNAEVIVNAETGRIMRMLLQIRAGGLEAPMELTMRPIPPGDPGSWALDIAGRTRVDSLADLRPVARPVVLTPGREVPDIGFTAPDNTRWSLYSALRASEVTAPPGEAPPPFALVLFRIPANQDRLDAQLALAADALRAVRQRHSSGAIFDAAVAGITQLGEFNPDRWNAARAAWNNLMGDRGQQADLLLGYSSSQSLDLFAPQAGAALIIITADRRLSRAIPLDGLSPEQIAEALDQ